jgi:hypothetical protein
MSSGFSSFVRRATIRCSRMRMASWDSPALRRLRKRAAAVSGSERASGPSPRRHAAAASGLPSFSSSTRARRQMRSVRSAAFGDSDAAFEHVGQGFEVPCRGVQAIERGQGGASPATWPRWPREPRWPWPAGPARARRFRPGGHAPRVRLRHPRPAPARVARPPPPFAPGRPCPAGAPTPSSPRAPRRRCRPCVANQLRSAFLPRCWRRTSPACRPLRRGVPSAVRRARPVRRPCAASRGLPGGRRPRACSVRARWPAPTSARCCGRCSPGDRAILDCWVQARSRRDSALPRGRAGPALRECGPRAS